jgi:hypothetical protein
MSEKTLPGLLREALSKHMVAVIVGLLWLSASGILAKFGDSFFDSATTLLGKRLLLQLASLLLFSSVYCVVLVIRSRKKKTVFDRLRPVKGKGYSIDPTIGDAVCPRCTTETRPVYLLDKGHALYCYVCSEGILK